MWAIANEKISLVHVTESHICLTERARLNGLNSNTILDLEKIRKHIVDYLQIQLSLRQRMQSTDGKVIVLLLNTTTTRFIVGQPWIMSL